MAWSRLVRILPHPHHLFRSLTLSVSFHHHIIVKHFKSLKLNSLVSCRQSSLLDLPLELRREIYRYCLVREAPIRASGKVYSEKHFTNGGHRVKRMSLLLVNKQINVEALDILYGENYFLISMTATEGVNLKKRFAKHNLTKIRNFMTSE